MSYNFENLTDPFWASDYSILYQKNRLTEFFPSNSMTMAEKLNSITRLSFYIGVSLALYSKKYLYLYIPICVMLITYLIYDMQKDNIEFYLTSDNKFNENKSISQVINCTKPTNNNPFMNINIISDNPTKSPACPSYDSKTIKKDIESKFNYNLYRDVSDLYGNNNSQRQYYTMPSTTIPNDQTSFAKWLYNTDSTCKENTIKCASYWDPFVKAEKNENKLDYLQ